MTSRAYNKCLKIMKKLVKNGNFPVVYKKVIDHYIKKHIGADKRTVKKYRRLLVEFSFFTKGKAERYNMNLGVVQQEIGGHRQMKLEAKKSPPSSKAGGER